MDNPSVTLDDNADKLPLVPLRDVVVFPYTMIPFVVGRKESLLAVDFIDHLDDPLGRAERNLRLEKIIASWERL